MSDQLISQAVQFQIDPDEERRRIFAEIGDVLDEIKVGGADVLVATWKPDQERRTAGGLILTQKSADEYDYQGVTGLILKLGPYAYKSEKTKSWFVDKDNDPDPPKVGEWVSYTYLKGASFKLKTKSCRLVNDQYILLRITRPDLIA
jgi:co-chaperonin GroES (HSP10)